jgi:ribosomal protein L29
MKLQDITTKTDAELKELLVAARRELAEAVVDSRTKEDKNTKRQAAIKLSIARMMTISRQRELTKLEEAV